MIQVDVMYSILCGHKDHGHQITKFFYCLSYLVSINVSFAAATDVLPAHLCSVSTSIHFSFLNPKPPQTSDLRGYITAQIVSFAAMLEGMTLGAIPKWSCMLIFCVFRPKRIGDHHPILFVQVEVAKVRCELVVLDNADLAH